MEKKWVITGLILIIIAIIFGAFGAHGLKKITSDEAILTAFDTATKYQFFQGLGFLAVPFITTRFSINGKAVFYLLLLGTIFFSGSIYGLTYSKVHAGGVLSKAFGPVTPIGGLLLIIGWTVLLIQVIRSRN
ncbi:DUF423 domain-containing protein [Fluviicola chungangensis]|uniref:DUF423 domain-containing protein n=1 Tax=Fluviicola chungangensis TaxID=2597671 RepID=A0A556N878_9FLAO|nr:DUF423 domain-containing protein [Fluviicola chungangensis]TSJ48219.1 DUF423 domain-containing protein [Fluviicola chungangensis]